MRKRYRLTKTNKILRKKAFKSHMLQKKSTKRKRHLDRKVVCSKAIVKMLKIKKI